MLISSLRLIKVIQSTDNTMSSAYYKCICTQITGIDINKNIFLGILYNLKTKKNHQFGKSLLDWKPCDTD